MALQIENKSTFVIGIIFTVFGSIMTLIGTLMLWRVITSNDGDMIFAIGVITGDVIMVGRSIVSVLQETGKI